MLHVLLTILKVIGIILLVILALLILLVLAVLFVPLRYRIRVKKEDGPLQASVRVSWLLRLILAEADYLEKQGTVVLRVCGLRLKTMRFPKTGGETSDLGSGRGQDPAGSAEVHPGEKNSQGTENSKEPESLQGAGSPKEPESLQGAGSSKEPERTQEPVRPQSPDGPDGGQGSQKSAGQSSGIRRILAALPEHILKLIEKVCGLLLRLLDLPMEAYDRADDIIYRTENKIRDIRRKIDPFFSVEAEHILGKLIEYLRYLIRGWKPRKAEGYLEFGTGSPDQTGKLCGLISLILPADARRYRVEPDFYEKRLRTDTMIAGRIRLYRALVVGLKLLLDKEFRVLLGRIRGKQPRHKVGKKTGK